MITPQSFLNHVLPTEGLRCCTTITAGKNKKVAKNHFFTTNEQAASFIMRNSGVDVYVATSSYKTDQNRTQANVASIKAFWLDIDAGEGKPYRDFTAAATAVLKFCDAAKFPIPTMVVSGGGIHAWWGLTDPILPDRWHPAANTLKHIVQRFGLDADASRTADHASILRVPGTYNWKLDTPRSVYCKNLRELVDTDKFLGLLSQHRPSITASNAAFMGGIKVAPDMKQGYGDGARTDALLHRAGYCLGPLHMNEEDAIAACLAWNQHNFPPLDEAKIESTVASIANREGSNHGPSPLLPVDIAQPISEVSTKPALPWGYRWGNAMQLIHELPPKEPGDVPKITKLFDHPCYLSDLQGRLHHNNGLHYGFKFWLPHSGWQEFSISAEAFHGSGGRAKFMSFGPNLMCEWPIFERYIAAAKHMIRNDAGERMIYEQFGWDQDGNFLLGNKLYRPGKPTIEVPLDAELTKRTAMMYKYRKRGDLNRWRAAANKLFRNGCEVQSSVLLASFASPILRLVAPPDIAGMILSLVTKEGGTGKTTTLMGAATVWGPMNMARIGSRDTAIATFRPMAVMNSITCVYDEFRNGDDKYTLDFALGFTDGRDKQRANKDGTLAQKEDTWCNLMITTSNQSLVDTLIHASGNPAMANRVMEVPLILPKDIDTLASAGLKDELEINCGFAGEAFIEYLMQTEILAFIQANKEKVLAAIRKRIIGAATTDRYYEYMLVAKVFANIIIKKLGLLNYDFERVLQWDIDQINSINAERNAAKSNNPAVDILLKFLNENVGSTLIVDGPFNRGKTNVILEAPRSGRIHVRLERSNGRVYIDRSTMALYCNGRYQYRQFVEDLAAQGVLLDGQKRITLGGGTVFAVGQSTALEIDTTAPVISGGLREVTPLERPIGLPRVANS